MNPVKIVVTLVAVILLNTGLIYAYRRWQQRKTNKRVAESVQEHVGQYFKLQETARAESVDTELK